MAIILNKQAIIRTCNIDLNRVSEAITLSTNNESRIRTRARRNNLYGTRIGIDKAPNTRPA